MENPVIEAVSLKQKQNLILIKSKNLKSNKLITKLIRWLWEKEESAPIMQQYLCTKEKFIQIKFLISETLSNDFISYVSKLEQEKISVINEEKL